MNTHLYTSEVPRSKRKTDDEVLDELLPTILVAGLDRITLEEMGAAVGLSSSTLLQRFGSRWGVIEAALDRSTDALEQTLAEPPPEGADPREALIDWLADLARPVADKRRLVGSLQVLGRDILVAARNRQARRHLGLMRQRIESALVDMGFDPAAATSQALVVEAHWHGLVVQWALHGHGTLDAWIRHGLMTLLRQLSHDDP